MLDDECTSMHAEGLSDTLPWPCESICFPACSVLSSCNSSVGQSLTSQKAHSGVLQHLQPYKWPCNL